MNKDLIISRFSKSATTYDGYAEAQQKIASKMTQLLQPHINGETGSAVEIGCGTGIFSRMLARIAAPKHLTLNDICPEMEHRCKDLLAVPQYDFAGCDAEYWELPNETDLIASCSTFQWFRDLRRFSQRAYLSLKRDGLFAFSTFGEENLYEINALTQQSLPYLSLSALKEMLQQCGFEVLCAQDEKIMLTFQTPRDALWHLKHTGVNCVSPYRWTKTALRVFSEQYTAQFTVGGGAVSLTYHPIYIICKK